MITFFKNIHLTFRNFFKTIATCPCSEGTFHRMWVEDYVQLRCGRRWCHKQIFTASGAIRVLLSMLLLFVCYIIFQHVPSFSFYVTYFFLNLVNCWIGICFSPTCSVELLGGITVHLPYSAIIHGVHNFGLLQFISYFNLVIF